MGPRQHFTIPISPLPDHPGGSIICTEPSPQIYLLTFTSPPDNRLTHHFTTAMLSALDIIEASFPPGVVVTTSSLPKFYSNGLDLSIVASMDRFFETQLFKLCARFLSYPMPTVALINGHAFAGGFMLAMHHDYRIFSGKKGFLAVNEVDFGAPIPTPLLNIYQIKAATPGLVRDVVLEGRRWTPSQALEMGLVDCVLESGGWDGVEGFVAGRGLVKKGATGVYRMLKKGLYREQLALLAGKDGPGDEGKHVTVLMKEEEEEREGARRRVEKAKM